MRLDTLAKQATAITAVLTLITSISYGTILGWGILHADYASADAVSYLYRKQIELDLWRYEDEQAELEDILASEELTPRVESKAKTRLKKVQKRINRLENKLEDLEE